MSPYREPVPTVRVSPPRRAFGDTVRRLGRAWKDAHRWSFSSGYPELLLFVMPTVILLVVSGCAGWSWFGIAIGLGVTDTDLDAAILGFLRAKRVRWIMRQTWATAQHAHHRAHGGQ